MVPIHQTVESCPVAQPPAAELREPRQKADWRQALGNAIRDPVRLCQALGLPPQFEAAAVRASGSFGLFVTQSFLRRIRPGDPHDPLLRQILPLEAETTTVTGFTADPVGDRAATVAPGLIHKYAGRCLIVATGVCAVHCRYCFRRHFPYGEVPHSAEAWDKPLVQIAADRSIEEVILSGGDPLMMVDSVLADLVGRLAAIAHVRRLRIHSRLPIVLPERVTDELIAVLRASRLVPWMVVHANHPQEIDGEVAAALGHLVDAGIPVLNQAVLLSGVNDNADALTELCQKLVDCRVMPYYLHQLDRVAGAAHFEVPVETGRALMAELRRRLPGYALPRYVSEEAGFAHKVPLD